MPTVTDRLRSLRPAPVLRQGALAVVPLIARDVVATAEDYLVLDEACAQGLVTIEETGPGGTVPVLDVTVRGERPVLLVEGEILLGLKQNRILNTTVLAPAGAKTAIPVSCVERGRWRARSGAMSSGSAGTSSLRSKKCASVTQTLGAVGAKTPLGYSSDQFGVWDEVEKTLAKTAASSATRSLDQAYVTRADAITEALRAFEPLLEGRLAPAPLGFAVFLEGRLAGADVFEHTSTCRKLSRKLLEGYALDGLGRPEGAAADLEGETAALLDHLGGLEPRGFASPGLGTDHRFEGPKARGFALEHDGRVLHVAAFPAS